MMTEAHHDHIVCTKCGKVEEFYDEVIETQQQKQAESKGFTMIGHSLYIYGLCKNCQ
jgi:Fur family ferric uptake transcriptional regulator